MQYDLKKLVVACALAFSILSGCTGNNGVAPSNESQNNTPSDVSQNLFNLSPKEKAIGMAKQFIISECAMATNADWAKSAVVTDAFPVYLDGVEDVSYYECKVRNNGSDAGYVLVNVNQTDVAVPQYSTEGAAPSEKLAADAEVSVSDLQFFRHDWFIMFAEKKSSNGPGKGTVIIEQGSDGSGMAKKGAMIDKTLSAKRLAFIERVKKAGGVNPMYTKDRLTLIYNRDKLIADSMKNHPGELAKTAYKDRWTSDELNNTFSTGWHLPKWKQIRNDAGMIAGCGPLALTMLYAYHRQFNGKTNLFEGLDLNSSVLKPGSTTEYVSANSVDASGYSTIKNVTFIIGEDCGAEYGTNETSTTMNGLENGGETYGDNLGYDAVLDWDVGSDFKKGKTALGHIQSERPCVVGFDSDGDGFSNHAGAIEGVKYQERKYIWNWYDREMWYLVNYGWGNKREWICVEANYGSDAKEYANNGNLYMWVN